MRILLFESIAFCISTTAFLYGMFKIYKPKSPFYFKMIVSAVGCYALEELWTIVDVICGLENDMFSVRLIGIFGCFCTFLTANAKGIDRVIDEKNKKNRLARIISFVAPITGLTVFAFYAFSAVNEKTVSHIATVFIVVIPAIIDSYFELKYLLLPNDKIGFIKFIRPISTLILLEYIVSFSYLFIQSVNAGLICDVISAVVTALLVLAVRKGAVKWKTLI